MGSLWHMQQQVIGRWFKRKAKKATIRDGHHTFQTPIAAILASRWAKLEDLSMASNFSQRSRFLAKTAGQAQFAILVLAGAVTFASVAAAADPLEVAVVESISGNSSGVEFMDYLHLGQVIRLSPREILVLSYKASCVRETITGGTVTVGLDGSQVRSGEVQRSVGRCGEGKSALTGAQSIAGRTFRGVTH